MFITPAVVLVALFTMSAICTPVKKLVQQSDAELRQMIREQIMRAVKSREPSTVIAGELRKVLADCYRASQAHRRISRLCSTRAHAVMHALTILCSAFTNAAK